MDDALKGKTLQSVSEDFWEKRDEVYKTESATINYLVFSNLHDSMISLV